MGGKQKPKNYAGRKWQITQNNPKEHDCTHEYISDCMMLLNVDYWCACDEVGEGGTYHTHLFLTRDPSIRFSQLKSLFPKAHIERCTGTIQENRDYVKKEGAYLNSEKATTNIKETFVEWGVVPANDENNEKPDKSSLLVSLILDGMSTSEIIEQYPFFAYRVKAIDQLRETLLARQYSNCMRDVDVVFVTGPTNTGKTYAIHEEHGFEKICRITSYANSGKHFDSYDFHPVLVFEEFASQVPITEMLNYLDSYPVKLPGRFYDRTAAYTKVYITSNLDLYDLYPNVQEEHPLTWRAFLRRIDRVRIYTGFCEYKEVDLIEVLKPQDKICKESNDLSDGWVDEAEPGTPGYVPF